MPATEDVQAEVEPGRSEPTKRGQYRKKRPEEGQSYRELFLVNDDVRYRVTTSIDQEIHKKMKRFLVMTAPEVTIVSYINNVLAHHLEYFKSEINEVYRHETEKPL